MPLPPQITPQENRRSKAGNAAAAITRRWQLTVGILRLTDATWRYSRAIREDDPRQGWKIHVSATPLSACETLERVLPILRPVGVLFKVPRNLAILINLNSGLAQFSQVGKFLTVYPRSPAEALRLAKALHLATRGLAGPEIPFDKRYRRNSLVFYRYGQFHGTAKKGGVIRDPGGKIHPDRRAAGCAVPPWLKDPFQRKPPKPRRLRGPIGRDYLAFRALAQRGKGGVYEAIDLSVSPPRLVILKEGRPLGEIDFLRCDGFMRARQEARLLRLLRRRGVRVPEVWAVFTQDKKRYVVLEKLPGRPLLPRPRLHPAKPSWPLAEKIFRQLDPLLAKVHAAGWVWRDCKPSHLFLHRGTMSLIDFEGACRIDDTHALPWGSPNYVPASERISFRRRAGTFEDDYALGVMTFQFGTGEFPPHSSRKRSAICKRTNCPHSLRETIENLLRC